MKFWNVILLALFTVYFLACTQGTVDAEEDLTEAGEKVEIEVRHNSISDTTFMDLVFGMSDLEYEKWKKHQLKHDTLLFIDNRSLNYKFNFQKVVGESFTIGPNSEIVRADIIENVTIPFQVTTFIDEEVGLYEINLFFSESSSPSKSRTTNKVDFDPVKHDKVEDYLREYQEKNPPTPKGKPTLVVGYFEQLHLHLYDLYTTKYGEPVSESIGQGGIIDKFSNDEFEISLEVAIEYSGGKVRITYTDKIAKKVALQRIERAAKKAKEDKEDRETKLREELKNVNLEDI